MKQWCVVYYYACLLLHLYALLTLFSQYIVSFNDNTCRWWLWWLKTNHPWERDFIRRMLPKNWMPEIWQKLLLISIIKLWYKHIMQVFVIKTSCCKWWQVTSCAKSFSPQPFVIIYKFWQYLWTPYTDHIRNHN